MSGLHYATPTQSGTTNSRGEFSYRAGEAVGFSLGATPLGNAPGAARITPIDLVGASDFDHAIQSGEAARLINLLVLLQSLDADHDPDNGIDLTAVTQGVTDLEVDLAAGWEAFRHGTLRALVNLNGGRYRSPREAINHILASLDETIAYRVPTTDSIDRDGDGALDTVIEYKYNNRAQVKSIAQKDAATGDVVATTELTYDSSGNLTKGVSWWASVPDRVVERYVVDPSFGLMSHTLTSGSTLLQSEQYEYDAVGNLTAKRETVATMMLPINLYDLYFDVWLTAYASIVSFPLAKSGYHGPAIIMRAPDVRFFSDRTTELVTTYERDATGAPLEITHSQSSLASQSLVTTTYSDGRPVRSTRGTANHVVQEWRLLYDESGNLTSCTLTGDGIVTEIADPMVTEFEYDPYGEFASVSCHSRDTWRIEHDAAGRISQISLTAGAGDATYETTTDYVYSGNRLTEILSHQTGPNGYDRRYILEYDDIGNLVRMTHEKDGTLAYRRVREYQTLSVSALP